MPDGVANVGQAASRHVLARYTDDAIVVYQAFSPQIAEAALAAGTFVPPFRRGRFTWIKPSFLWMMYRSGWATKPGQERVLAVQITRTGFEWALDHATLSHFDSSVHRSQEEWLARIRRSQVRVQWDPDRSITLAPLDRRAIQVGLGGQAIAEYVEHWIGGISDVTETAVQVRERVVAGDIEAARALLPVEKVYPLPEPILANIGASSNPGN